MTRPSSSRLFAVKLRAAAFFTAIVVVSRALAADTAPADAASQKRDAEKLPAAAPQRNLPTNQFFKATAEEMDRAMRADSATTQKEPLQFSKGNGVRLLMTGHSWVAPGRRTLLEIAAAAGFDGHHQRAHLSGGGTGSANSIWLTEFGKFPGKHATPVLLPAIATGQWDVMTWGGYYGDTVECFGQWIDVCLRHNPAMKFAVQDGWPTYRSSRGGEPADAIRKSIDEQQERIQHDIIQKTAAAIEAAYPGKVHVIPAGAAVVEMLHHYLAGELPGFDCISEHLGGKRGIYRDGGHLSVTSGMEYLVGYLYYGMLYRQSPERIADFHPRGVDPVVDRHMRRAAWNAIIHSPLSGITDKEGKGVADP